MEALTAALGPCGYGWRYSVTRMWTEPGHAGEVCAFATVDLFWRNPATGEWSDAVPGVGGSMLVASETGGLRTSDEAYKMAVTDALSVACKALGVGASVYRGRFDGSKHQQPPGGDMQAIPQTAQPIQARPFQAHAPPVPGTSQPFGGGAPAGFSCPECRGGMFDNRADIASGKASPKAPAFKCRSKECGIAVWQYGRDGSETPRFRAILEASAPAPAPAPAPERGIDADGIPF
jgi:hypothetical protein